ncbi:MAG: hypothetical protein ACYTHN_01220 [Planctomycetota bacterium]|jgi:hypothetical protein
MLRRALLIGLPAWLFIVIGTTLAQKKDMAKAEKTLEMAEKYLYGEGVRKSLSRACTYFKKARQLLPEEPATKHLDARIALGLGQAFLGRKKYKEAAEELRSLALGFADRLIRWKGKIYGSGQGVNWTRALQEARKAIEAETNVGDVLEPLTKVAEEAGKVKHQKRYVQVAEILLGFAHEKLKKYKDAADYYNLYAKVQVDHLTQQAKHRAKMEAGRPRTPKNIPVAEAPPGKLEGKYKKAVILGLDWLKRFQKKDGSWSEGALEALSQDDPLPAGRVKPILCSLPGALACMAFLRAGVQFEDETYGETLKKGLEWTVKHQGKNGKIPTAEKGGNPNITHALYTWVLAEAVIRLKDPDPWKGPLEKGVAYLLEAQNPGAGWRYGIKPGDNDSEHTAQALIALIRAKSAGIDVPEESFDGAHFLLDRLTDEITGKVGFTSKGDMGVRRADAIKFAPVDTSTALSLAARILFGEDPRKGLLGRGFDTLWGRPPQWIPDKDIHLLYSRYYTLAYGLRPGADANYNLKRMADMLVKNQETEKSATGSWPPIGSMASDGRIATTTRAILSILNARGINLPEPLKREKEKGGK